MRELIFFAIQLSTLLKATMAGPVRFKVPGKARAMLYRVAMETGLRRNELRTLTPAQRRQIIARRGFRSDGDGRVHRTSNLDVHHKDRNPRNNAPSNLRVLTKIEHRDLHSRAGR